MLAPRRGPGSELPLIEPDVGLLRGLLGSPVGGDIIGGGERLPSLCGNWAALVGDDEPSDSERALRFGVEGVGCADSDIERCLVSALPPSRRCIVIAACACACARDFLNRRCIVIAAAVVSKVAVVVGVSCVTYSFFFSGFVLSSGSFLYILMTWAMQQHMLQNEVISTRAIIAMLELIVASFILPSRLKIFPHSFRTRIPVIPVAITAILTLTDILV